MPAEETPFYLRKETTSLVDTLREMSTDANAQPVFIKLVKSLYRSYDNHSYRLAAELIRCFPLPPEKAMILLNKIIVCRLAQPALLHLLVNVVHPFFEAQKGSPNKPLVKKIAKFKEVHNSEILRAAI